MESIYNMEIDEDEVNELNQKIKELQLRLNKKEETEESRQFSILKQQVFILNKEVQKTKSLLRLQKCQRLFEKTQRSSILNKIPNFAIQASPAKASFIQKLSNLVANFQGKVTLHNQLKKLLQKEKENMRLRTQLAVTLQQRLNLGKDYSEITKKLSDDNSLTKKIKYLEEQMPLKIQNLDHKRRELGKLRAKIQELKLNFDDGSAEALFLRVAELEAFKKEINTQKSSLKSEIQKTEVEVSEAASQKPTSTPRGNYDLNKVELKSLQMQLIDKDKELNLLEKQRKEFNSKLSASLKLLSTKKK